MPNVLPAAARRTGAALAEVHDVGLARGAVRRAVHDSGAALGIAWVEDHRAMRRAAHPRLDDRLGRSCGTGSPGDVLANVPIAGTAQIAGLLDAVGEIVALGRDVREVPAPDHVAGM